MPHRYVFRSAHPDVLAAVQQCRQAREERRAASLAFAQEVDPDRERRPIVARSIFGPRLAGFEHQDGWAVPVGWRAMPAPAGGVAYIEPNRRTKAGKAAHARLTELKPPHLPHLLPGMPGDVWTDDDRVHTPGVRERGGAVWAWWGAHPGEQVDRDLWEPVKLSEFYAMVESDPDWADVA